MELYQYDNSTNAAKRSFVRNGKDGNKDVAYQMVRLTRLTAQTNKAFQDFVNRLFIESGLDYYSPAAKKFQVIFNFVKENVRYLPDIAGDIESIKTADRTLSDGYGDCDDLSILFASMLGVAGVENVYFILANYGNNSAAYSHIYVIAKADGKRFVFDAAIPNGNLNDEVKPSEAIEINVFQNNQTDTPLGQIKKIELQAKDIYRQSLDVLPFAASFLPLSFFAGKALDASSSIAAYAAKNGRSINKIGSDINQKLDEIIVSLVNRQIAVDYAKVVAMQLAAHLSAYEPRSYEKEAYKVIKQSLLTKLQFINNYKNISGYGTELNQKAMLAIGFAGAAYIGYKFIYKEKIRNG